MRTLAAAVGLAAECIREGCMDYGTIQVVGQPFDAGLMHTPVSFGGGTNYVVPGLDTTITPWPEVIGSLNLFAPCADLDTSLVFLGRRPVTGQLQNVFQQLHQILG